MTLQESIKLMENLISDSEIEHITVNLNLHEAKQILRFLYLLKTHYQG